MAGWRLREAAGEAWRSVSAGLWRTVTLGVVTAGLVGALVWVELGTSDDVLGFQRAFERRGGWVGVATDPQARIDAAGCAALAHHSGVVHAGALGAADTIQTTAAPGTLFQTAAATSGAIRLWAADPPAHGDLVTGLVLGQAAADELGLRPGMHLSVAGDDRIRSVGAVVDTEARNPFITRWILDVAPPAGTAAQCWVEFSPENLDIGLQVLEATFADLRTGRDFYVVNNHFDHQSEESRQNGARMNVDLISEWDSPVIVAGDFNNTPDTPIHKILADGGLTDTMLEAEHQVTPVYGTWNGWDPTPSEEARRIDWIMAGPQFRILKAAVNTYSENGLTPSDHWAAQALVSLP